MKKILFIAGLFISLIASAQPTTIGGYITVNEKRNQLALVARALNLPTGGTPALSTGQWVGFGGLYADSTGGNRGIHYYNGTAWIRLVDTTWSSLITTRDRFGFSGEDATAAENRVFSFSTFTDSIKWTNLGSTTGLTLYQNGTGTGSSAGVGNATLRVIKQGALSIGQTTSAVYISNENTGTGGANVALRLNASGKGTGNNLALIVDSGFVGIGEATPATRLQLRTNNMHETESYINGFQLNNDSAATATYDQYSPSIWLLGAGWKTNATAGSQLVKFGFFVTPEQGAAAPTGKLQFMSAIATTVGTNIMAFGETGQFYNASGSAGTSGQVLVSGGASAAWSWVNQSTIVGSTPALQQVITAGATLAGTNLIDVGNTGGDFLSFSTGGVGRVSITNTTTTIGSPTSKSTSIVTDAALSLSGHSASQLTLQDSIKVMPYLGRLNIDTLRAGYIDTTDYKPMAWSATTGMAVAMNSWAQVSGGSGGTTWNGITDPTGDQALTFQAGESSTWTNQNTTEDLFTVNDATTTTSSLFSLNRTTTALAAGNNLIEIISSGANGTNAITATGIRATVTNTNATSGTNIAAQLNASGATTANWALFTGSATGADGRININNAANIANQVALFKSLTNTGGDGIVILANNETAKLTIGYNTITASGGLIVTTTSTGVQFSNGISAGAFGTPTSTVTTGGSFATAYRAITALRTLDGTDHTINVTANSFTVTLPSSTSIVGRQYVITNSGSGTCTVSTTGGETFLNVTATPTSLTLNQFNTVILSSTGGGWLRVSSL